jgi:uncharacterized protein YwgA
VDRAARPLTTRDTVLLITHAAGDQVAGRTIMQKLAYFTGLGLQARLGHRPHYFGPYSSKVEDAVANAVIAGELRETAERLPDWHGGPDVLKYTYDLAAPGKERVDRLIENNAPAWDRVRDSVQAVKAVLPTLDQKTLSAAAKTYLIISESDEGVDEAEIPKLAKRLGWELSARQASDTVTLLERLELVDTGEGDDAGDDPRRS